MRFQLTRYNRHEKPRKKFVAIGYPKLAHLMGVGPEIAIFRKFGWLATLNLMRLQAELGKIEEELQIVQQADEYDQRELPPEERNSRSFAALAGDPYGRRQQHLEPDDYGRRQQHLELDDYGRRQEQLEPDDYGRRQQQFELDDYGRGRRQLHLMRKSVKLLREYNELLLQTAQVSNLGRPDDGTLQLLRDWLIHPEGGDRFQTDTELSRTWDEPLSKDLVCLTDDGGLNEGAFKRVQPWIPMVYRYCTGTKKRRSKELLDLKAGEVYEFSESGFLKFARWWTTTWITTAISLLPALMILWLNSVADRIYITIGMTGALGLLTKIITDASMKEVLTVTVAFAAVEVVFIGTAAGSGATTSNAAT